MNDFNLFEVAAKSFIGTVCSFAGLAAGAYLFKTLFPDDPTDAHMVAVESMGNALLQEWEATDEGDQIRKDATLTKARIEEKVSLAKRNYIIGNMAPLLERLSLVHSNPESARVFRVRAGMLVNFISGVPASK